MQHGLQVQSTPMTASEQNRRKTPRLSTVQLVYRAYRWRGIGFGIIAGLSVLTFLQRQPERYVSHSRLIVENESFAERKASSLESFEPFLNTQVAQIEGTAFLAEFWSDLSDLAQQKTLKPYDIQEDSDTADKVALLKSAIDARRKNDSLLIDIEVAHPYPYVSKYLADELAHGYVRYTQELQAKQRARERADLEKTALDLSQDLKATAQDLQAFRQSSGLSITEGGDSIQSSQLQAVTAALSKAKIERIQKERQLERLENARQQGQEAILAIDKIQVNPDINRLKTDGENLRRELAGLSSTYQRKHPKFTEIVNAITSNRRQLDNEIEQVLNTAKYSYNVARDIENGLREELAQLESNAQSDAEKQARYSILQQRADAQKNAYEQILAQLSQEYPPRAYLQPTVRVLETATLPSKASFPDTKDLVLYPIAAFFATILTLPILSFITSTRFKIWHNIEEELGTRILGTLPQISHFPGAITFGKATRKKKRYLPTLDFHRVRNAQARESLASLASQLLLGPFSRGCKTLLVTSHCENEGKSMTVYNLAREFANAGKKTLVVDCDLRRDVLCKAFEKSGILAPADGLSLAEWYATKTSGNENAKLALCHSHSIKNLDFIPGGDGSKITTQLFLSPVFTNLIAQMKQEYDVILVDSPPAGAYSDAFTLTTICDELLFVIRDQAADRLGIKKTLHTLRSGHSHIAGVALNGLSRRHIQMIGTYYESSDMAQNKFTPEAA